MLVSFRASEEAAAAGGRHGGPPQGGDDPRLLEALLERMAAIHAGHFERLGAQLEELRSDVLSRLGEAPPAASHPQPPRAGDWAQPLPKAGGDATPSVEAAETATPTVVSAESRVRVGGATRMDPDDFKRMNTATEIALSTQRWQEAKAPPRPSWLKRFAESSAFEGFFGFATIANAAVMGVQADYLARNQTILAPIGMQALTVIFSLLFIIELGFNMWSEGRLFYRDSQKRGWNLLDVVLVVSSLPELVLLLSGSLDSDFLEDSNLGQARLLRILRVTRLIRIVRITRVVRFIRALRTLVHQIASTLKSLIWGLLLLVLLMYGFGIMFTQTVTSLLHDGESPLTQEDQDSANRFWGTLPRSMFTLYESVTGGISWDEVVAPFDGASLLLFCVYIALTQLAVLNVLTGVFCQNAIESAQRDQDIVTQTMMANKQRFVKQLRQLFKEIDTDGSGTVTIVELEQHLQDERVKAYFESMELEASDAWAFFKLVDEDMGNTVDVDEFVEGCMRLRGAAKQIDVHLLSTEQRRFQTRYESGMQRLEESLSKVAAGGRSFAGPQGEPSAFVRWV